MIDLQDMVVKSLGAYDSQRDRSQQVEIGPSSIGGCRRRTYYDLKQVEKVNETEKLAAILGTFIHAGMEQAITRNDPFGDNFLIEIEVEHEGLKGHCDLYIKNLGLVVDWKTITKSGIRYLNDPQKRYQIHVYGYLLSMNGYEVKEVAIVGIPRDGKMKDITVLREPYDESIALEGIAWLNEVKEIVAKDLPIPAPEKFVKFCADYCPYFDQTGVVGCPSIQK